MSGVAALTFAANGSVAQATGWTQYVDGLIKQALGQGKTLFVDYAAHWCSTCAGQERVIKELRVENPAYNQMMFVRVDWDTFGSAPISRNYAIPRRSTLLVLKGDQELGRIVAATSKSKIKALMDTGLAAVSA